MIAQELVTLIRFRLEQAGIGRFQAALQNMRQRARQFGAQADAASSAAVRGAGQVASAYQRLGGIVRGVFAGLGAAALTSMADDWASVEGRVSLTTDSMDEQKHVLDELFKSAQRNRQEYTATADLYQKVARTRGDLGLSVDDSLKLTDVIGKAMAIGGGDAGAQQAALLQLGQALASGVLRGDELNSILEQSPRLAEAIADAFGVSVGQLRDMGKQGKLTSKELAQGLLKQADKLTAEFERLPKTFSGSFTIIKNKLGQIVSGLNKSAGAAEAFYRVSNWIIDNFQTLAVLIGGGWAVAKFTLWRNALLGTTQATNLLTAAQIRLKSVMTAGNARLLGQMVRLAAILYGLYLIGEDIYTWLQGGESVMGSLIGRVEEWRTELEQVKEFLGFIKDLLGGAGLSLKEWAVKGFAVLAVVLAVSKILGVMWTVLKGIRLAVAAINAAVLANPVAAALVVIIGLLLLIWYYWDEIKAVGAAAWAWIKASALAAWGGVKAAAAAAWESIKAKAVAVWEVIKTAAAAAWAWVLARGAAAWDGIRSAVASVTEFVKTAWDNAIKAVTGWIDGLAARWERIKAAFSGGFSFNGFSAPAPAPKGGSSVSQTVNTTVYGARDPAAAAIRINNGFRTKPGRLGGS